MPRFRSILTVLLGCVIAVIAGREPSRPYQVANTHQSEFRCASLSLESIPVSNFTEQVYGSFFSGDLFHQARRQFRCGDKEINRFAWRDWRIPFRWWCISESFGRCWKPNVDAFDHKMTAFISRGFPGILYLELDNENSGFVSESQGSHRMHVCTELPFGTGLGEPNSSAHPIRLHAHSDDLTRSHKNQSASQVNDPPVRRRFLFGLFGCVGGYGLALCSLGLRHRWFRWCGVGLGCLGVLSGLLGWWITFAFPRTWGWLI